VKQSGATPGQAGADADEESALVAALRQRSPAAFEKLVRAHGATFLIVARRYVSNQADAVEVVQESFLRILQGIDGFLGDARLTTWMHRIVVNCALMRLRSQRRRPETPIEDLLPRFLEDGHQVVSTEPWRQDALELLANAEKLAQVRAAIDKLPDSYRIVLMLRDIDELSTEEAADLLGVSPAAVKVRLHRARQALRAILEPLFVQSAETPEAPLHRTGGASCP
jgi:RNA polymerase sigma-70 factor (ECF subfamily)